MFCRIPLWSHPVLDFHLLEFMLLLQIPFYSSDQSVKMSVSSWFSLDRLYVSRNLSIFSPILFNLLAYDCSYYYLMIFSYICGISCYFYAFISYFIWGFSIVDETVYWFINFVYLFKESALGFIDLFYCYFGFYFIYFFTDLHYFFLSAMFGLCSTFYSYLEDMFGYLRFVFFLEKGLYCYKLLS